MFHQPIILEIFLSQDFNKQPYWYLVSDNMNSRCCAKETFLKLWKLKHFDSICLKTKIIQNMLMASVDRCIDHFTTNNALSLEYMLGDPWVS